MRSGVKVCKSCRSRQELVPFLSLLFEQIANSNEYLLAKIGVDTAENEPLEVWLIYVNIIQYYSFVSLARTSADWDPQKMLAVEFVFLHNPCQICAKDSLGVLNIPEIWPIAFAEICGRRVTESSGQ